MDRRFLVFGRFSVCVIIVLVLLIFIVKESAAGRRGIGRVRYSSGKRYRVSTKIYTTRRLWGGYSSPYRSWNAAGRAGYIYGFVYYTRTRYYRDYPDREPTICRNDYDYRHKNGTPYHLFICPSERLTSDYNYCCGDESRQTCCRYQDRRGGMNIFGIIAGFLAFVAFAGILVYCCCFRRTQTSSQPFFQSRIMSQRLNTRFVPQTHYTPASTGTTTVMNPPIQIVPTASYQQSATPLYPLKPQEVPMMPDNYADGHGSSAGYPPTAGYPPSAVYPPAAGYPPSAPTNDPAGYGVGYAPPPAPATSPPPPYPAAPYPAPYPTAPPGSYPPYPPSSSPVPPYPSQ